MRAVLSITCLLATAPTFSFTFTGVKTKRKSIFRPEQVIFTSGFNITKLMVPFDSSQYIPTDSSDIPSIFFTIADSNLEGGSCMYVLEGFAAYEILEGGRDATMGYGQDPTVYIGSHRGVYKYIPNSLTAKKFGPFRDDITQLQKAKNIDLIYFLTTENNLYKLENAGTMRSKMDNIYCVLQFVLDTANNIYYLSCEDFMLKIVKTDGSVLTINTLLDDFGNLQLLRPAFIMEESVLFFGDNNLYFLYSNGTYQIKDLHLEETPTAFSVEAALYIVAAKNGKIYEFNVMDMLLKSMFGFRSDWPADIAKIVMSFIDTTKKNLSYVLKHENPQDL